MNNIIKFLNKVISIYNNLIINKLKFYLPSSNTWLNNQILAIAVNLLFNCKIVLGAVWAFVLVPFFYLYYSKGSQLDNITPVISSIMSSPVLFFLNSKKKKDTKQNKQNNSGRGFETFFYFVLTLSFICILMLKFIILIYAILSLYEFIILPAKTSISTNLSNLSLIVEILKANFVNSIYFILSYIYEFLNSFIVYFISVLFKVLIIKIKTKIFYIYLIMTIASDFLILLKYLVISYNNIFNIKFIIINLFKFLMISTDYNYSFLNYLSGFDFIYLILNCAMESLTEPTGSSHQIPGSGLDESISSNNTTGNTGNTENPLSETEIQKKNPNPSAINNGASSSELQSNTPDSAANASDSEANDSDSSSDGCFSDLGYEPDNSSLSDGSNDNFNFDSDSDITRVDSSNGSYDDYEATNIASEFNADSETTNVASESNDDSESNNVASSNEDDEAEPDVVEIPLSVFIDALHEDSDSDTIFEETQ